VIKKCGKYLYLIYTVILINILIYLLIDDEGSYMWASFIEETFVKDVFNLYKISV